jgi:glycosyltransferase involved in cell wall biosynthesis
MASSLGELVGTRPNDYRELERRYAEATGGELVTDPFDSVEHGPSRLTRSASVLIGAHNSARSLVPALIALEQSTFNRRRPGLLEVIVVDDGSTDDTRSALLELDLDLNWRYVRKRRGGLSTAHNTGLAFAQGDVIVFCDADVVQLPGALEELIKRHQVLDGVTLLGFRFDIDPADERLERPRLADALPEAVPAFWGDFRLSFPGWPSNICRDTDHLRELGCGRHVRMANGARYDLPAMVVGAFFSIERDALLAIGGSDERLVGWGCEDSLIGARSLALGNAVVPVYSAVGWHVSHPRREEAEVGQFRRNLATLNAIYSEPFEPTHPDLGTFRDRATEVVERAPARRRRGRAAKAPVPLDDIDRAEGYEALARYGDALAAYREAPECAQRALGEARCHRALGDRELALEAAEAAVALAPESGDAALVHALALADTGGFGEARLALERLRSGPADPPFEVRWVLDGGGEEHKLRGNEHARQGLHRIAVTDFELAVIVGPGNAWAHFDRAHSLSQRGLTDQALESMRRADDLLHPLDGNRTWVHSALGTLHSQLGNTVTARSQTDRALALYQGNGEARAVREQLR